LPCNEDADLMVGVFVFARALRAECGVPPGWPRRCRYQQAIPASGEFALPR